MVGSQLLVEPVEFAVLRLQLALHGLGEDVDRGGRQLVEHMLQLGEALGEGRVVLGAEVVDRLANPREDQHHRPQVVRRGEALGDLLDGDGLDPLGEGTPVPLVDHLHQVVEERVEVLAQVAAVDQGVAGDRLDDPAGDPVDDPGAVGLEQVGAFLDRHGRDSRGTRAGRPPESDHP